MKKALLIGDSIRLGYSPFVREALRATVEVFFPEENCRNTQYTFVSLSNWLNLAGDPKTVDVVHWNNGHWDIAHWRGDPAPLNTPEQYAGMLARIHHQLRECFPNAAIVFALTTPMNPDGITGLNPRSNREIEAYNTVARDTMDTLGVPVNDLYTLMADKPSGWYIDYAHFTEQGYQVLAQAVARAVWNNLPVA